jgi:hypothetical protein
MQSIGFKKTSIKSTLVVIGPSDINKLFLFTSITKQKYLRTIDSLAKYLSTKFEQLYIIPDDGVFLDFAISFKKYNSNVCAYLPNNHELKYKLLEENTKKHHLNIKYTDWNWMKLNNLVVRNADTVLCLGYSSGVFIEIGNIKIARMWENKDISLIIDTRFVSSLLPKELAFDLPIIYYSSLQELKKHLEKI